MIFVDAAGRMPGHYFSTTVEFNIRQGSTSMERQFACPHCQQVVAVAPAAMAIEAQCPYCQGLFLVGSAEAAPTPTYSGAATKERIAAEKGGSPFDQPHIKYAAVAGVMLSMAIVPVVGFALFGRGSRPAVVPAQAKVAPSTSSSKNEGVVLTGAVVMNEAQTPPPGRPTDTVADQSPSTASPAPVVASTGVPPAASTPTPPRQDFVKPLTPQPLVPKSPIAPVSAEVAQVSGGAPGDSTALVGRIEPSVVVVQVKLEKSSGIGSGFPLDDKGTIVTNYHVIEGAKSATIKFGQKTAEIEGFLVYSPGKDIAILKAKLGPEQVAPLKLAAGTPAKGEPVLTFGAPLGFDSTVSNGIVSSVRKGTELQEIFKRMAGDDIYVKQQHYDLDAVWVQTTAPISGGNSGGPLVNLKGEVVGLNTWALTIGQNMNFAISASHITQLLASANSGVHPFSELPAPREKQVAAGNGRRTLEYWNEVSKINRNLAKQLNRIRQPTIPKNEQQLRALFPKLAGIYKKMGDMLPDTADKLKALKIDDVDGDLVALVTVDALVLDKLGQEVKDMSADAKNLRAERLIIFDSEKLGKKAYGEYEKLEIGQAYDVLRIRLTKRYGETFASIFDASSPSKSAKSDDDSPDAAVAADNKPADPDDAKREKEAAGKLKSAKLLKDAGKREAAKKSLEQIVERFAGTKAAGEAQKLLDELE
ncbi:MAG TPA: trypsin-like peptidase domain-containing protein [Pirellulales bacterium]|nr:trypsin-like peptidase domain-containing protein [Pirellulales bacterium]